MAYEPRASIWKDWRYRSHAIHCLMANAIVRPTPSIRRLAGEVRLISASR
jgi:hypothetical protein